MGLLGSQSHTKILTWSGFRESFVFWFRCRGNTLPEVVSTVFFVHSVTVVGEDEPNVACIDEQLGAFQPPQQHVPRPFFNLLMDEGSKD